MEIIPGVHQITHDLGGLPLHLFALVQDHIVLIDSGTQHSPITIIQPYLRNIQLGIEEAKVLIVTHGHDDHCGGNAVLKRIAPSIEIIAHQLDVPWIENHKLLFDEIYGPFSKYLPNMTELEQAFLDLIGKEEIPVDRVIEGEHYVLEDSKGTLELFHTPGHTPGLMMVYDRAADAAFVSDAIQARGLAINGKFYMPIYMDVDQYLQSLYKIKSVSPRYVFPAHFETKTGRDAQDFIDESISFVEELDYDILEILRKSSQPADFELITHKLLEKWLGYEPSVELFTICAAHLRRLVARGLVKTENDQWYPLQ
jgi:glyoxylase-like metal-dependent hydrolase (beta-lactamase superfamily II)